MKQMQNPEQKRTSQDRIRELIAEYANGSQQEFCDACGVAKSSISQYVNRTNAPGNVTAAKIANRYGLNPLWVMGFDVPKTLNSDADNFRAFATDFNKRRRDRIIEMNIRDKELLIIEKYRQLDRHGIEMVDIVLDKEYDRCKPADESWLPEEETYELNREEFENTINGNDYSMAARNGKNKDEANE